MNMKLTSLAAAFALAAGMGAAVNAEETIDSKEAIQLTANQMDGITAGYYYNDAYADAFAGAFCYYYACNTYTDTYTFAEVVHGYSSVSYSYSSASAY